MTRERSPISTYNILASTVHATRDKRKQAMHNPCDPQRATTHRHTSQTRHRTEDWAPAVDCRAAREWRARENVVVAAASAVGRQIVRACSGRRAGRRGNATDDPVTRYTTSDCGRESAARTRFPWKQRHHCITCATAATSQHHHHPNRPGHLLVRSVHKRRANTRRGTAAFTQISLGLTYLYVRCVEIIVAYTGKTIKRNRLIIAK